VKKFILAAAGTLAVTAAMALPAGAGTATAAVIPPRAALHSAPGVSGAPGASSAAKQTLTCSNPELASATVRIGPADVSASGTWDKDKQKLVFALSAAPSFGLSLVFTGAVTCNASLPTEKFPIADTGLILKITPKMHFAVTGKIGADFTWHPSIKAGFAVSRSGFSEGTHSYANGAGLVFKGSGTVTMSLDLHAVIETVGGAIGVEGDLGPTVTGQVSGDTAGKVCWKGSVLADAKFDTFVDAFGFKKKFLSHEWKLGRASLSSAGCRSAPCFQAGFPTCTSFNPLLTFTIGGGDVGCTYSITVNWGDTTSTTKPVAGVAPGKIAATFTHTYGKPRTYMLSYVSTVTGGDCFGNSGTMEFTLAKV
jgi:hypothetical protein